MKRTIYSLFTVVSLSITLYSCTKESGSAQQEHVEIPIDSSALLINKWQVTKDSSTNIGDYYFMDNGSAWVPTPGVYFGVPDDFIEFKSDATVRFHEANMEYLTTYALHPNNKLVVTDMMVHDTATIVELSKSALVFDWKNTSPNGGKYFRRIYMKR